MKLSHGPDDDDGDDDDEGDKGGRDDDDTWYLHSSYYVSGILLHTSHESSRVILTITLYSSYSSHPYFAEEETVTGFHNNLSTACGELRSCTSSPAPVTDYYSIRPPPWWLEVNTFHMMWTSVSRAGINDIGY